MKPNKSIDGLVTRDAKKSASTVPTLKKATKKPTKVKKVSKPVKTKKTEPVLEESLDINILEEKLSTPAAIAPEPSLEPTPELSSDSTSESTTEPEPTTKFREQSVEDFLAPVEAFNFDKKAKDSSQTTDEEPVLATENIKKSRKQKKAEKKAAKKEGKKKPSKARLIITSVLLVIVLAIIGVLVWAVVWGNDIIAKITGGQGSVFDLLTFVDDTYEPLKTDSNGRTNILAFGTSGYNMQGDEGNGVHDGAALTDSIMMIKP